jgi:hypothetical protein
VDAQGSYTELLKSGINFAQLLRQDDAGTVPDVESESPTKILKYKGTGIEVLTRSKSQPSFRRSSSMSMLEMGSLGTSLVPEEFAWEEEASIARSFRKNSRRESKPIVPTLRKRSRRGPRDSVASSESTPLIPKEQDEQRSTGDLTFGLYWKYIRAGSSLFALTVLFFSNILVQVLFSGTDYFLQYWTQKEELRIPLVQDEIFDLNNTSSSNSSFTDEEIAAFDSERTIDIYIYSGLIGLLFFVSLVRTAGFLTMCLNASINLHRMLFNGVLRAPMRLPPDQRAYRMIVSVCVSVG